MRPSKESLTIYSRINATIRQLETHLINGRVEGMIELLNQLNTELGDFEDSVKADAAHRPG